MTAGGHLPARRPDQVGRSASARSVVRQTVESAAVAAARRKQQARVRLRITELVCEAEIETFLKAHRW